MKSEKNLARRATLRAARAERKLARAEAKLAKAEAKLEARKAKLVAAKQIYKSALAEAEELGSYHDRAPETVA